MFCKMKNQYENTWWSDVKCNNLEELDIVSLSFILIKIELFSIEVGACLSMYVKFLYGVIQPA